MRECFNFSLNFDGIKKPLIGLILIFCLCFCAIGDDERAEDAQAQQAEQTPTLNERQIRLLENLGIEYEEGEPFERIMERAHSEYRRRRDAKAENGEAIENPIDFEINPAILRIQEQASEAARQEFEARRLAATAETEISPTPLADDDKPEVDTNDDKLRAAEQKDIQKQNGNQEEPAEAQAQAQPKQQEADTPETDAVEEQQIDTTKDTVEEITGQAPPAEQRKAVFENKELELTITLPEKVEITSLIELVGKQLGLNYIYDPAEVKGDVMLKVHDGRIKVKDTYALLESVLRFRGFVMTRRGSLVTIVPATRATEIDPMIIDDSQQVQPGDVIVTNIFRLKNITTDIAQNLLTSMNLSSNIISLPETRSIIVTGYAYRMARVEQMLSLIDVPGERRDFAYRRLEYTLAASVVDKIQALAENLGTVDVTIGVSAAQQGSPGGAQPVRRDSRGRIIPQPAQPQQQQGQQQPTTDVIQSQTAKYGVYLDIDDRTNRILIVGTENDIIEVNRLIDTFDVPKQDLRKLIKYTIEFADAADILMALESLNIITIGNQQAQQRPTAARAPTQQGQQPQQQAAIDFSGNILLDEPQVVMIEQSNSLLVNATDEQHERIVSIIAHIDQEPEMDMAPVKVYPLENQSVEDIQETLTSVVEKVAQEKASAEQGAQAGAAASATGKIQRTTTGKNVHGVVITGDSGTNSIVVFASRKDQEWIEELIKSLDKKRPQVLIDVTLVEIRQNDKFEFALKHAVAKSLDSTSGASSSPLPIGDSTIQVGNYLDGSSIGGTLRGFYSDSHIQTLLEIVETQNFGRVMAKPKLLVNDNQEGVIKTTNTTYRPTTKTDYVGQDNPIAVPSTTWNSYEAGVEMTIKPHISEGELLRLEISVNRTDFDRSSVDDEESGKPYDTISSEVNTIVTVPDKSTIILGGLISIVQAKGGGKVPILSDIPIIGGLFKTISNSSEQSKLYLFVKADILRPDYTTTGLPQLEEESQIHRDAFEMWERQFQEKRDWPGFDGEPVEPERVLEMK